MSLIITPQTRVGQLLEAYPELESVLIEFSDTFKKLQNPVLRRTVARLATLQTAANIANVNVAELMRVLRTKVGQDSDDIATPADADVPEESHPEWASQKKILTTLDIDKLLDEGEHPLSVIQQLLKELKENEMIQLNSSFRPQPLIDELRSRETKTFSTPVNGNMWETLITL